MLSYILWIVGGLIAVGVLYVLFKILLIVFGIKKMVSMIKEEVEELPKDYERGRKIVHNEHPSAGAAAKEGAKLVGKVGWRWFKKL